MRKSVLTTILAALSFLLVGCSPEATHSDSSKGMQDQAKPEAMATIQPAGTAATQPSQGNVTGTVRFYRAAENMVRVVADLQGLPPSSKHGIHIHEKATLTAPDLSSAGGHFNPTHQPHDGPHGSARHAGDLGNIEADVQGKAHLDETVQATLDGPDSIIGKSVIIHAKVDDLKSQPAGDSGARIAGGVIEKR